MGTGLLSGQEIRQREEVRERRTAAVQVRRVSTLIGASVQVQGEVAVGKIEDIIIDENGCIDFLIPGGREAPPPGRPTDRPTPDRGTAAPPR